MQKTKGRTNRNGDSHDTSLKKSQLVAESRLAGIKDPVVLKKMLLEIWSEYPEDGIIIGDVESEMLSIICDRLDIPLERGIRYLNINSAPDKVTQEVEREVMVIDDDDVPLQAILI